MPRAPSFPFAAATPFAAWQELALHTGEMLTASAQVIAHRSHRIATAGHSPSARDQREFQRMGWEKVEAAGESMFAMAQQLATMNMQLVMRAWQDLLAASTAWVAFASSRTVPQLVERQFDVLSSAARSAHSASQLSGAAARIAKHGLKPIHSRATANAKRLSRLK